MDRRAETDSGDGRRDQLGAGVREANAEIQSGSYCVCFECPDDIDRMVVHRGVVFFKIAFWLGTLAPLHSNRLDVKE